MKEEKNNKNNKKLDQSKINNENNSSDNNQWRCCITSKRSFQKDLKVVSSKFKIIGNNIMAAKNEMIRKKQKYKVNNWPDYNLSLKKRGSLEIWISDNIEKLWYEKDTINDGTGKPKKYTEKSIELCYSIKLILKQPLYSGPICQDTKSNIMRYNLQPLNYYY